MTVNSISSSTSNIQNIASNTQQLTRANVRNAFQSLSQALQSGDLQGAQQAFATIQSAWNARTNNSTQNSNGSNTVQDAFNNLGKALQSGDLQGAQNAFNTLKGAFAAHKGGHHHHHHASGADPDQATSASSTSTTTSTNGVTTPSALFSALLQQLASGTGTAPSGATDTGALLNALLQQQVLGGSTVTGATGLTTNQSTFSVIG